jgi:hypothetical protein
MRPELPVEVGAFLGSRRLPRLHNELFTGLATDEHVPLSNVFEFSHSG